MLGQCICSSSDLPGKEIGVDWPDELRVPHPRPAEERGLVTYSADLTLPLIGPALRSGEVWYLGPEDGKSLTQAVLSLHANGIRVKPDGGRPPLSVAWSPFSLVQACRLHSVQADEALPWLRLFKVSVFHHGSTHIFATQGEAADRERAHWLADVSRALRVLTQSLFPTFSLRTMPLPGAGWTATRLLAGYLLLCDDRGVSLVYAELHSHYDGTAMFAGYEDEYCDCLVLRLSIDLQTCVTERVGVDCSCFSLAGRHLTARTCAEKTLWLRAVSNVKVKLRHCAENPTATELMHYRAAVLEHARRVEIVEEEFTRSPLLPRRPTRSGPPPKPPQPGNASSASMVPPSPRFPPPAACIGGPSRLQQLMPPRRPPSLDDPKQEAANDDPPPAPLAVAIPVISNGPSGGSVMRLSVSKEETDDFAPFLPSEPDEATLPDTTAPPLLAQAIRNPFPGIPSPRGEDTPIARIMENGTGHSNPSVGNASPSRRPAEPLQGHADSATVATKEAVVNGTSHVEREASKPSVTEVVPQHAGDVPSAPNPEEQSVPASGEAAACDVENGTGPGARRAALDASEAGQGSAQTEQPSVTSAKSERSSGSKHLARCWLPAAAQAPKTKLTATRRESGEYWAEVEALTAEDSQGAGIPVNVGDVGADPGDDCAEEACSATTNQGGSGDPTTGDATSSASGAKASPEAERRGRGGGDGGSNRRSVSLHEPRNARGGPSHGGVPNEGNGVSRDGDGSRRRAHSASGRGCQS